MRTPTFFSAATAVLCLAAGVAQSQPSGPAPASTAGLDIVLTIEHTESSLPGGFPTMGAVTQTYATDGTYSYSGSGGPNHLSGTGTYTYVKTGPNSAIEDAVQYSSFFTLPYQMHYTFVTPDAGRWKQYFAGGLIVFEGSFATSPHKSRIKWAPARLAGTTLALMTVKENRRFDLSIVAHREFVYLASVSGTNHIETGTYTAKMMSARSLVAETTGPEQSIVRSFTFTGPNGGYWRGTRLSDGERSEGFFLLFR